MVKRTITITTILLILAMVVSLIIVLNKSSFAADDDIASGTDGTCSWIINANGVVVRNNGTLTIIDGDDDSVDQYTESYLVNQYGVAIQNNGTLVIGVEGATNSPKIQGYIDGDGSITDYTSE